MYKITYSSFPLLGLIAMLQLPDSHVPMCFCSKKILMNRMWAEVTSPKLEDEYLMP